MLKTWQLFNEESSEEFKLGMIAEKEHKETLEFIKKHLEKTGKLPSDEAIYQSIVKDHLEEHPDYYTKLKAVGL